MGGVRSPAAGPGSIGDGGGSSSASRSLTYERGFCDIAALLIPLRLRSRALIFPGFGSLADSAAKLQLMTSEDQASDPVVVRL